MSKFVETLVLRSSLVKFWLIKVKISQQIGKKKNKGLIISNLIGTSVGSGWCTSTWSTNDLFIARPVPANPSPYRFSLEIAVSLPSAFLLLLLFYVYHHLLPLFHLLPLSSAFLISNSIIQSRFFSVSFLFDCGGPAARIAFIFTIEII